MLVTLFFGAADREHNQAVALCEFIGGVGAGRTGLSSPGKPSRMAQLWWLAATQK